MVMVDRTVYSYDSQDEILAQVQVCLWLRIFSPLSFSLSHTHVHFQFASGEHNHTTGGELINHELHVLSNLWLSLQLPHREHLYQTG